MCHEKEMPGAGNTDEQDIVLVLKGIIAHQRRQTSTQGASRRVEGAQNVPLRRGE